MTSKAIGDIVITSEVGIDMSTSVVSNLTTPPVTNTDGASKQYVDDNIPVTSSNLGGGEGMFESKSDTVLQFKTFTGNVDMTMGRDSTNLVLSKELFSNPFPMKTIDTAGISIGSADVLGGVLAPNGKIYCPPNASTSVLIIDPATDTADSTTITGITIRGWANPVLGRDGKIYAMPGSHTAIFILDPNTNELDTTSVTMFTGTQKFRGTMLAPNGKIYGMPGRSTRIVTYDPDTGVLDTTTMTFSGIADLTPFDTGALGPNGKIYCPPSDATKTLIIDTISEETDTTTIPDFPTGTTEKFYGAVLAENGKIYCVPREETRMMIIDTATDIMDSTSITGLPTTSTNSWRGGGLGGDGLIYMIPTENTRLLIVDPSTDTADTTTVTGLSGSNKWRGSVLAPNGKFYIPTDAASAVAILSIGITTVQPELLYNSSHNIF